MCWTPLYIVSNIVSWFCRYHWTKGRFLKCLNAVLCSDHLMHTRYNNGGRVGQEGTPVLLISHLYFWQQVYLIKSKRSLHPTPLHRFFFICLRSKMKPIIQPKQRHLFFLHEVHPHPNTRWPLSSRSYNSSTLRCSKGYKRPKPTKTASQTHRFELSEMRASTRSTVPARNPNRTEFSIQNPLRFRGSSWAINRPSPRWLAPNDSLL